MIYKKVEFSSPPLIFSNKDMRKIRTLYLDIYNKIHEYL